MHGWDFTKRQAAKTLVTVFEGAIMKFVLSRLKLINIKQLDETRKHCQ